MPKPKMVRHASYDIPPGLPPDSEILKSISTVRKGFFNRELSHSEVLCKFFNDSAYRRRCILFFDKKNEVSGYLCLQSYRVRGGKGSILRCQAALKKQIRGRAGILRHVLIYLFSERRVYTETVYLMFYMISPLSYSLAMKYSKGELWPSYRHEGDVIQLRRWKEIILAMDKDIVERDEVFIHKSNDGFITEKVLEKKSKHAEFFLRKNPGYINGDGLVVIARLTIFGMLKYGFRFLTRKKPKR